MFNYGATIKPSGTLDNRNWKFSQHTLCKYTIPWREKLFYDFIGCYQLWRHECKYWYEERCHKTIWRWFRETSALVHCMLHSIESPLHHLFKSAGGKISGPRGFTRPIGKQLLKGETKAALSFTPIEVPAICIDNAN